MYRLIIFFVLFIFLNSSKLYAQNMMEEHSFWLLIEKAWEVLPELDSRRKAALENNIEKLASLENQSASVSNKLYEILYAENQESIIQFIYRLEEKLFKIDREEIHEVLDGSEDFFLYNRGFIVGMGKNYYEMVDKEPEKAVPDVAFPELCFVGYKVNKDKFGEEFERGQYHNIETFSYSEGW